MVNKVILVGNLGRDPEVRSTPSGQSVAEFRLATTRRWRDRDGNRQEQTEWHSIVAWGKLAEICGQYLHKGKQVYIEGRLQTRSWEDKNHGDKRYKTEVVADEMKMLGSRGDSYSPGPSAPAEMGYGGGGAQSGGAQSGGAQSGGSQSGGGQGTGAQVADGPDDDDIPF